MWFTASLLFNGIHDMPATPPSLWEEVVVLISAESEEAAKSAAEVLGRRREHEYQVVSPFPHLLKWQFSQVERVCQIEDSVLVHGAELFTRFLRASEVTSLLTPFEEQRAHIR